MKRYFVAEIKEGKFKSDKEVFRQAVKDLPSGRYLHCLMKISDRTADEWRAYYFAQIGAWSNDTGYDKKYIHALVKSELFPLLFETERSTTELDNDQWNILMWNLQDFLLEKFTIK